MKYYISLLLFTFLGGSFSAQAVDIVKELKELNQHYFELEELQLNFEIEYIDRSGFSLAKRSGEVVHTKEVHFVDLNGNITLINKDEYVSINNEFSTIIYSDWNGNSAPASQMDEMTVMIDSLWENRGEIDFEVLSATKNQVRVLINDNSDPNINGYEMLVDINKNKLLEFKYYLRNLNSDEPVDHVIVRYTNETSKVKLKDPKFKVSNYVKRKGKELEPTTLFAGYEIISQNQNIEEHE
ncbi:MAG: hypothetical protein GQ574_22975 [Crocinitomix sp.]|nr:hypothetical protein [Crocinitomix sp.]